jgi:uncharacterized Rmd1/YagE family protein
MTDPSSPASARTPDIGMREVVGAPLAGSPHGAEARALLIGTRIDTRNLLDLVEPDRIVPGGAGAVFVFRYGVVVFFGASPQQERDLLAQLMPHVIQPQASPHLETATIAIQPGADEQIDAGGTLILGEATVERLLLTATVLARSVVLERDEIRIAEVFDSIEPLVNGLQAHGRAGLPIRRVMQHIGDVLATQHRVVGRAQISEKPDVLWDHPELDRLYARLEAEYELGDRARTIERKLEVIGETADVLLDLVQDKRSVRLELAVIALIAFEICLTIVEMVRG